MAVLLVSFDLNGKERPASYEKMRQFIERNAASFKHPMFSQWMVETNKTPQQFYEVLKPAIDSDDKLLVPCAPVDERFLFLKTT